MSANVLQASQNLNMELMNNHYNDTEIQIEN